MSSPEVKVAANTLTKNATTKYSLPILLAGAVEGSNKSAVFIMHWLRLLAIRQL